MTRPVKPVPTSRPAQRGQRRRGDAPTPAGRGTPGPGG
nr:MAG TPA: hypothetical protein [Caudoviricetes sp.]